jgi:hypothetical protein
MNQARLELTKAQAADVAALAYAAGTADQPITLQEIYIKIEDLGVQFGATNAMIVAARRGSIGEFGGVAGTGHFSVGARRLAKVLRMAIRNKDRTRISLAFGDGYMEVNGQNIGSIRNHEHGPFDRITDLVGPYFSGRFHEDESATVALPSLKMNLLHRLAKSAGEHTVGSFRQDNLRPSRWYFISSGKDSWQFVGAIMETRI